MLPASHRLHTSAEIRSVARSGRRFVGRDVILHIKYDRTSQRAPRACVIVSKAVGNAVVRNVVRRRLRESMRTVIAGLPTGVDIVVRARESASASSFHSLVSQVNQLLVQWSAHEGQKVTQ